MSNIISIILLAVSGAMFFLWINPLYVGESEEKPGVKQLLETKRELDEKINKTQKIEEIRTKLRADLTKLESTQSNAIKKLNKMVPNDMENARLINYIDSIKKKSRGTQISDIKIDTDGGKTSAQKKGKIQIKKNENYKSVVLSFSFTSKYNSFVKFLDDIYKSLRVVDIVSINVSPSKENKENIQDKFKFDIKIRTYWLNK